MSDETRPTNLHPALMGREEPMESLTGTVRRLIELTVTNLAPEGVLEEATRHLDVAAELLAAHVPTEPVPRFIDREAAPRNEGAGTGKEGNEIAETETSERSAKTAGAVMGGAMPYDPVIGRFNPLALPVRIVYEPPLAIGNACFTTPYEGGPGWVHGAVIAAAFDIVLTAANQLAGAAGPTVWLTIRYKRPTLIGVDSRFEASIVSHENRRVRSQGRLLQDGMVCVEAEGEFAVVPTHRLRALGRRDR